MRLLAKLALIVLVLGGGYYVLQRPEIQPLFKKSAKKGDPLAFLNDLPEIKPKPKPDRPPAGRKTGNMVRETAPVEYAAEEMEQSEPAPEYVNQVPNDQLRTVLMQILGAKKLTKGVSLSVTDSVIEVTGEVDSSEKRRQILDIVDRGREARRLDGKHLKVSSNTG